MATTFIYALCEPGTRTVRYIGKTVNPKDRLQKHRRISPKAKTHLGNWIRSLLGTLPNMVILREVPEAEGSAAEIKYIRIARESLGMPLVNATDGGEGTTGCVPTAEARANMSAAQAGEKNPMFGRTGEKNPRFGTHHSAGTLANIRAAMTPEVRAKIGAATRGKKKGPPSAEASANQSAAMMGEKNHRFGKPRSAEARAKQSAAITPEECARRRAAVMGEKNPMFGKRRSPDSRAKQSAAWTPERRAVQGARAKARKGVPWSPARRAAHEANR